MRLHPLLPAGLGILLIVSIAGPAFSETSGLRQQYLLDNVLRRHVRDGGVDYAALKGDEDLDRYLAALAEVSLEELRSDDSLKSFWINVHNACVLKAIAEKFPVDKVQDVPNMFGEIRWTIAGTTYSLDQMQEECLRPFGDPAILFALCNGAKSAPKLRSHTYTAHELDRQLQAAVREYVQNPANLTLDRINTRLTLPLLFRWYEKDFQPEGVPGFLSRHLRKSRDQLFVKARNLRLEYGYWDWRVNVADKKEETKQQASEPNKADQQGGEEGGKKEPAKGKVWSTKEGRWK